MKFVCFTPAKAARCAALLLALPLARPCLAGSDAEPRPFKLSLGEYFYADQGDHYQGQDLNLRYRVKDTSLWAGYYQDPVFGHQARVGFDTSLALSQRLPVSLLPSLQLATQHFVGGSLAVQFGDEWFLQTGIGRTNLRPYANLNFDPNDALTVAVGHHWEDGRSFTLSTLRDDRLHSGQRHSHAMLQWPLPGQQRVGFDLLRKTGSGGGGHVATWGGIATYELRRGFLRLAYDPQQNFGTADVWRLSTGLRF